MNKKKKGFGKVDMTGSVRVCELTAQLKFRTSMKLQNSASPCLMFTVHLSEQPIQPRVTETKQRHLCGLFELDTGRDLFL